MGGTTTEAKISHGAPKKKSKKLAMLEAGRKKLPECLTAAAGNVSESSVKAHSSLAKKEKSSDSSVSASGDKSPFKKPILDIAVVERISTKEAKIPESFAKKPESVAKKQESAPKKQKSPAKKRRESTSSTSSDVSIRSNRSRHGSTSSNASEASSKEKVRLTTKAGPLAAVKLVSRRIGRACREAKSPGGKSNKKIKIKPKMAPRKAESTTGEVTVSTDVKAKVIVKVKSEEPSSSLKKKSAGKEEVKHDNVQPSTAESLAPKKKLLKNKKVAKSDLQPEKNKIPSAKVNDSEVGKTISKKAGLKRTGLEESPVKGKQKKQEKQEESTASSEPLVIKPVSPKKKVTGLASGQVKRKLSSIEVDATETKTSPSKLKRPSTEEKKIEPPRKRTKDGLVNDKVAKDGALKNAVQTGEPSTSKKKDPVPGVKVVKSQPTVAVGKGDQDVGKSSKNGGKIKSSSEPAAAPKKKKVVVKKGTSAEQQRKVTTSTGDSDTDVEEEEDVMTHVQVDDEITLNISESCLKQMAQGFPAMPPRDPVVIAGGVKTDQQAKKGPKLDKGLKLDKGPKLDKGKKKVIGVRKGRSGANTRSVNIKL